MNTWAVVILIIKNVHLKRFYSLREEKKILEREYERLPKQGVSNSRVKKLIALILKS